MNCAFRIIIRIAIWLPACPLPGAAEGNPVLDWSALMMAAIRADNTGPTLSTRNLAILSAATYDAVNSITRTHQPYRFQLLAAPETSVEAAVAAVGLEVMEILYPSFRSRAEALYQNRLDLLPPTESTMEGVKLGHAVATRFLEMRGADGATTEVPYIPSSVPGQWQRTPPFFRPPLTPHWRHVETFCIPDIGPFLPKPPPSLGSEEYARDLEEVKRLGEKNSPFRTADQSEFAVFWSDFSYTAMPPGHWHEIAAGICHDHAVSLADTARLFALLGLAQADAAIVCWDAKYLWNLWRPLTAIHRADEDGNPRTDSVTGWDSFLAAPPFPAYPSGHSTFSQASAQVLKHFFGTDSVRFTARSDSLPGVFRDFHSLQACVDEVGMSRIFGGIHFPFDNTEGKRLGEKVGNYVVAHYLLPNDLLPLVRIEANPDGSTSLRVHGHANQRVVLEWSADMRSWRSIATNTAVAGGFQIRHSAVTNSPVGFFRVRE